MWEAIESTEIEPGQTIKFGGGDLEYEVLNVTRAPITNTVTSLITRRSSDGYTTQLAPMLTAGMQPWRKYAAPPRSDEGLIAESSETPAPDEWSAVEEIRAALRDAVKVELPRSEATQEKLREERTRKAVAAALLGKGISNNGELVGTIVEASFTDDGLQVIAHKPTTPLGFDFNTTLLRGEPQLPIPPSLRPRPAFVNPGVSIHRDGAISVDGRGPLTGVFGQGDGALFWQKLGNPLDEKPEPTFTLAQLKTAVKKARKRARRSALREMYGFIRNNLKLRAAEYGRIAVRFGMEDRS